MKETYLLFDMNFVILLSGQQTKPRFFSLRIMGAKKLALTNRQNSEVYIKRRLTKAGVKLFCTEACNVNQIVFFPAVLSEMGKMRKDT